jgi:hypothetical protein
VVGAMKAVAAMGSLSCVEGVALRSFSRAERALR